MHVRDTKNVLFIRHNTQKAPNTFPFRHLQLPCPKTSRQIFNEKCPPFKKWRPGRRALTHTWPNELTYRLFLLLHARGHLEHRPVNGGVLGEVRKVLGEVHRHWFGGIQRPRSERELTHGGRKALKKCPQSHLFRAL